MPPKDRATLPPPPSLLGVAQGALPGSGLLCLQGPPGAHLHLHQDLQAELLPPAGLAGGLLQRGLREERRAPGEAPALPLFPGEAEGEGDATPGRQQLTPHASAQILPLDSSVEHLLGLLEVATERQAEGTLRGTGLEDPKEVEEDARPLNALCKRLSEDAISRKVRPLPGR